MKTSKKVLSVARTAVLCGVGHSTVGYWIRSKKLCANRVGRNYSIPIEELLFFLKSTGQNIPEELADGKLLGPYFRTVQNCWQYWQGRSNGHDCKECTVFKNQLEVCFTAQASSSSSCSKTCFKCQYYLETYLLRIQFIHQINYPAAVYKGLHLWGGNRSWAKLCEVQESDLPGMSVERAVHHDSLAQVISNIRRRALGDLAIPRTYNIFLKNNKSGKLKVRVAVYPLSEPSGANLLLAEPGED